MNGASFGGPESRYRWTLHRIWNDHPGGRYVNFLMLNPSTADHVQNDPTVERCERRARAWGYDGLWVTNLFALRATDPRRLLVAPDGKVEPDPVGPHNDAAILDVARQCAVVVAAWGVHGALYGRESHVYNLLLDHGILLHCLGTTRKGAPRHPLYVSYEKGLERWG